MRRRSDCCVTFRTSCPSTVTEPDVARAVLKLMDLIDDLDDVQDVHSNFDIGDDIMEQLAV